MMRDKQVRMRDKQVSLANPCANCPNYKFNIATTDYFHGTCHEGGEVEHCQAVSFVEKADRPTTDAVAEFSTFHMFGFFGVFAPGNPVEKEESHEETDLL